MDCSALSLAGRREWQCGQFMVALLIAQNGPGNLSAGGALGKLPRDLTEPDAPESEHLLHHAKAQRKSKVQPDRVAEQLRRKAVVGVEGLGRACHGRLIPTRAA